MFLSVRYVPGLGDTVVRAAVPVFQESVDQQGPEMCEQVGIIRKVQGAKRCPTQLCGKGERLRSWRGEGAEETARGGALGAQTQGSSSPVVQRRCQAARWHRRTGRPYRAESALGPGPAVRVSPHRREALAAAKLPGGSPEREPFPLEFS